MHVLMNENKTAAPDGITVVELAAGEVYNLPADLAQRYIERGLAEPAEAPAAEPPADPSSDPDPDAKPAAPAQLPDGFAELNAKAAQAAIAAIDDTAVLDAVEAFEQAKGEGDPGKIGTATRVSVLRAVEARRRAVAAS